MQSRNPFLSDMADLMTDAFSAAQAAGEEARAVFHARAERMAAELDLVTREEFEAVRAQAAAASEEVESLRARVEKLEAAAKKPARSKSTTPRKTTKKSSS
ncbi:diacylglyceryl transferase [Marinicauda salina]|uniref:Diacylglyceryl transferase n=1 Tax=Marinicauda salina TaxID=2135793 RepID=A0A2U2BRQ0_9PROT|nr:accessory factor UbiK family protein [Marinicauda salina]PWE16693.1 diacylglyceryl transferase [Marinicauda salina]